MIINKLGLHARAAAKFVGIANQYGCKVTIGHDETDQVDGKSIMQMMMLAATKGTKLKIDADGADAADAIAALSALVNRKFEEEEVEKEIERVIDSWTSEFSDQNYF